MTKPNRHIPENQSNGASGARAVLVKSIQFDPKKMVELPGGGADYGVITELSWNRAVRTVHYLPDRDVYEVVLHKPGSKDKPSIRIPASWCTEVPWPGTPLAFESDQSIMRALTAPAPEPAPIEEDFPREQPLQEAPR